MVPLGVTRSTEEAMAVLKKYRREAIAIARIIARDLIRAHGSTHSRAVLEEMTRLRLMPPPEVRAHWLGAVFHSKEFAWTGERYQYTDSVRNIHEREIKVWRLR